MQPDHPRQGTQHPLRAVEAASGELPPCVHQADNAAERLVRAALAPFPDLGADPQSFEEVVEILHGARDWGRQIHEAFGDPNSDRGTPGSLWALFSRSNRQALTARLMSTPHLRMKQTSRLSRNEVQFDISGLDEFQIRTEPTGPPHFPTLESAADVLGDIPPEFNYSCALTLGDVLGPSWVKVLSEQGELITAPLTLSEWPRIRITLRYARNAVLMKSLGFAEWVRARIINLRRALYPEIHIVRNLKHNKCEITVQRAGVLRTTELTNVQVEFLRRLVRDGESPAVRKTKFELVKTLPELGPWIEAGAGPHGLSAENEGMYRLAEGARPHIHVEPRPKK